jgi:hypothetical protein
MMFSFKAIMKDRIDNSEYRLEHPEGDTWHMYYNNEEISLMASPQMYRDGGTIQASFWLGGKVDLNIPQQLNPQGEFPARPTINGIPLELTEWWLGGERRLNGVAL